MVLRRQCHRALRSAKGRVCVEEGGGSVLAPNCTSFACARRAPCVDRVPAAAPIFQLPSRPPGARVPSRACRTAALSIGAPPASATYEGRGGADREMVFTWPLGCASCLAPCCLAVSPLVVPTGKGRDDGERSIRGSRPRYARGRAPARRSLKTWQTGKKASSLPRSDQALHQLSPS